MEYYPGFESPPDSPEASEKKEKKKKKAGPEIARSLDKFSTYENAPEPQSKAEKVGAKRLLSLEEFRNPKPVSEQEAPTGNLGDKEENKVNQLLAVDQLENQETTAPQAAKDFLAEVAETGEQEQAFEKVVSELGSSPEEIAQLLKETSVPPEAPEEVPQEPETEEDEGAPDEAEATEPSEGEFIIGHEDEDAEAETPAVAATGGNGGLAGPPSPPAGGAGSVPPGAGGPAGPRGGRPFGPLGGAPTGGRNPNVLATNPDMLSSANAAYYERRGATRGLLVGGILGYLIGRRGGRIRTEKRLLPIQKRLEKQVEGLKSQLIERETKIRQIVAEKLSQPARPSVAEIIPGQRGMPLPERLKLSKAESRLGLAKPARAERLGKVIVGVEAKKRAEAEASLEKISPVQVETMNQRQLLEVGEKIIVEGASLRQIFESRLIGERSLRYLIGEYLQGKDIRHDLRREMVEREIDFERDPVMRDRPQAGSPTNISNTTLETLLEKAGATPTNDDDLLPTTKLQAVRDEDYHQHAARKQRLADLVLVATIITLLAFIIFMLINR
ncbi:MAG TPA: hypothetical protein VLG37_00430 [Candidatus Saccharimonadales bacterium]|nr:hypothetical protein [Candidatus Saccharimonadales bacterium]